MYSECLKSELVWILDSSVSSHFQTVRISDKTKPKNHVASHLEANGTCSNARISDTVWNPNTLCTSQKSKMSEIRTHWNFVSQDKFFNLGCFVLKKNILSIWPGSQTHCQPSIYVANGVSILLHIRGDGDEPSFCFTFKTSQSAVVLCTIFLRKTFKDDRFLLQIWLKCKIRI